MRHFRIIFFTMILLLCLKGVQSQTETKPAPLRRFDLSKDPGEKTNVADQFPEVVRDMEARLVTYAKEQKTSEWLKAQPSFMGPQGKTVFDPGFDINDGGLPREKPVLPKK